MILLAALLHTLALLTCLCVQWMGSPLAGTWLFFHVAGCVLLLYNGEYSKEKGALWYATLAWLIAISASPFLFAPIQGSGSVLAVLIAMPSLALCLRKEHLNTYICCFGGVILLYALGLLAQEALHVEYSSYDLGGRRAWPLLDPNNAAAVLNVGLLSCLWLTLFRDLRFGLLVLVLGAALLVTGSKAGIGSAAGCGFLLLSRRYGVRTFLFWSLVAAAESVLVFFRHPEWIVRIADSLADRFPIWQASWPLLWIRPWGGLGLGGFGYYYGQVRTERYTGGWYAHNDLLQLAIEAGLPITLAFLAMIGLIAISTCRKNIASGCVLLAIFMEAMVEFQFYVPAVSLLMGLALAYHILNRKES